MGVRPRRGRVWLSLDPPLPRLSAGLPLPQREGDCQSSNPAHHDLAVLDDFPDQVGARPVGDMNVGGSIEND